MPRRASKTDRPWDAGWEGHELEQLRRLARLSFAQKLAWLEEAQSVEERLARSRRSRPGP